MPQERMGGALCSLPDTGWLYVIYYMIEAEYCMSSIAAEGANASGSADDDPSAAGGAGCMPQRRWLGRRRACRGRYGIQAALIGLYLQYCTVPFRGYSCIQCTTLATRNNKCYVVLEYHGIQLTRQHTSTSTRVHGKWGVGSTVELQASIINKTQIAIQL